MKMIETELNCQHHVMTTPGSKQIGDDAYCRFHGYQRVTMLWPQEWRVLCQECTWGRWAGQRESNAKRIARSHKHVKTFCVYDTITKSGGTSRKILLKKFVKGLTADSNESNFDPNEPIPF